jgi:hypothetical protein
MMQGLDALFVQLGARHYVHHLHLTNHGGKAVEKGFAMARLLRWLWRQTRVLPCNAGMQIAALRAPCDCGASAAQVKCVPWLPPEPSARRPLDLVPVRFAMAAPPVTLGERMRVEALRGILRDTRHSGFPVVRTTPAGQARPPEPHRPAGFCPVLCWQPSSVRGPLLLVRRRRPRCSLAGAAPRLPLPAPVVPSRCWSRDVHCAWVHHASATALHKTRVRC